MIENDAGPETSDADSGVRHGSGEDLSRGDNPGRDSPLTPHDRYFRYVFGQPEPARDLVVNVFRHFEGEAAGTGAVADSVVSVTPHSLSFVDDELGEHRTDLLVTLQTASGRELAVHMLFEHKARNDPGTIYQLLRYNAVALSYLARERRKEGGLPPPIISVVVYNGPGSWSVPTQLSDALDFGSASESQMTDLNRFRYFVFDVGLSMSESFIGGPVAKTALQAMYAASRKLGREGLLEVVRSLTQRTLPCTFRETTMKYLVEGRTDNAESILATLKKQKYTYLGDNMISFAEKVRREGEAKGKAEGLAETLLRQLGRRFTLKPAEIDQVRAVTNVAKLQAALDEIIEPHATADSVLEKLR